MPDGVVYCFDDFELDSSRRVLFYGGKRVDLPDRCLSILLLFTARAGEPVHKRDVQRAGWNDQAIADESITQAIFTIRSALHRTRRSPRYIVTERKYGYRFVATVTWREPERTAVAVDAIVSPYRVLSSAHAAVGTMALAELQRARELIRSTLYLAPQSASANIDMATACILSFEASRVEMTPEFGALDEALRYARAACDIEPKLGAAWSTLAFAQERTGDRAAAIASAALAVTLDPDDAWHQLRLGFASYGEGRRRAAAQLKKQCPHYAGAHWLDTTVLLPRQAFLPALDTLDVGCALQDSQQRGIGAFNAVGLHLMRGNTLAALGRDDQAIDAYRSELAGADPDHLYMRECCANSAYSIAAVCWRNGRFAEAERGCREALAFVPGHPLAVMLLAALTNQAAPDPGACAMYCVDPILTKVAPLSLQGRHGEAAALAARLLTEAPPGSDGWLIAAEPLIHATAHVEAWAQALRILHDRAIVIS